MQLYNDSQYERKFALFAQDAYKRHRGKILIPYIYLVICQPHNFETSKWGSFSRYVESSQPVNNYWLKPDDKDLWKHFSASASATLWHNDSIAFVWYSFIILCFSSSARRNLLRTGSSSTKWWFTLFASSSANSRTNPEKKPTQHVTL